MGLKIEKRTPAISIAADPLSLSRPCLSGGEISSLPRLCDESDEMGRSAAIGACRNEVRRL
jgi:hypothetical protein